MSSRGWGWGLSHGHGWFPGNNDETAEERDHIKSWLSDIGQGWDKATLGTMWEDLEEGGEDQARGMTKVTMTMKTKTVVTKLMKTVTAVTPVMMPTIIKMLMKQP